MTPETDAMPGGKNRLPPALATDFPVLVALVMAWATVSVFWAHVATGFALIAIVGMHLATRRRLSLRGVSTPRRFAYALFLVAATAMAATGLLRLVGVPAQYVWHGGISYLVLGFVVAHIWSNRRALRARMRARTRRTEHESNTRGARDEQRAVRHRGDRWGTSRAGDGVLPGTAAT